MVHQLTPPAPAGIVGWVHVQEEQGRNMMFGGRKPPQPTPGGPAPTSTTPPQPPTATPTHRTPVGFETVIGAHTSLKGEIQSQANVRIDGMFDGAIDVQGNMMIGETARINADIHTNNITISGAIHGNVFGNKVQLTRTARVWGDINAASITTEEGAYIDGKITMAGHPAAKGLDQPALSAPEVSILRPSAEDATSGEPVEVEMLDEHPTSTAAEREKAD
jgi:cytoskeletal protein CcmA (bactofilin family)